jgi:hypothetical protein
MPFWANTSAAAEPPPPTSTANGCVFATSAAAWRALAGSGGVVGQSPMT